MTANKDQADLAAAVDLARHAPSVHNTQPWEFAVAPGVLTMRRDETRRLPVLDPDSRQVTISCGAAMHLARLALRTQGYDAEPDVVRADSHGIEVHLAAVPGQPATETERTLAAAARDRHMQRGAFEDRAVDADVARSLRRAAEAEGVWVRLLETSEEQIPLAVLLARADEAERDDEAYQAELAQWTNRPEGSGDGVPSTAGWLGSGPRGSDLRLREFTPGEGVPAAAAGDDPPAAENPLVAVLGTENDTPYDWLTAGQAMSALLVTATAAGVQASPLGQVLDQPWARRRLAGELGVVGHPQMVLRLGYAEPGPETPRRGVDELLT